MSALLLLPKKYHADYREFCEEYGLNAKLASSVNTYIKIKFKGGLAEWQR